MTTEKKKKKTTAKKIENLSALFCYQVRPFDPENKQANL